MGCFQNHAYIPKSLMGGTLNITLMEGIFCNVPFTFRWDTNFYPTEASYAAASIKLSYSDGLSTVIFTIHPLP